MQLDKNLGWLMDSFAFQYVFPVIRGVQGSAEFYTSSCPISVITKLLSSNVELSSSYNPAVLDLVQQISSNPINQAFRVISIFIQADLVFDPIEKSESQDLGWLKIPINAQFYTDQEDSHLVALNLAFRKEPELGNEAIPVVFYPYSESEHTELIQKHSGTHEFSTHPLNQREIKIFITKSVISQVKVFENLTDLERSNLPIRSKKLFTFSGIQNATSALLANHKDEELNNKIKLAIHYWNQVNECIPAWQSASKGEMSAGEIRQKYIHSHTTVLISLGHFGASLISSYPKNWEQHLAKLKEINWSRSNLEWQNRIFSNGRISKSQNSVNQIVAYLFELVSLA